MKFFSKTLIATAISITLSGCGSSGGDSKPVEAAKPKMTNTQPTETEKTAEERAEEAAAKKAEEEKKAAETQRALAAKKAAEEAEKAKADAEKAKAEAEKAKAEAEKAKAEVEKANSTASASTPTPKTEDNAAVQPAPKADTKVEDNAIEKSETENAKTEDLKKDSQILSTEEAKAELAKGFLNNEKESTGAMRMSTSEVSGVAVNVNKYGQFSTKNLEKTENYNKLVVDGQSIDLTADGKDFAETISGNVKVKANGDNADGKVRYGIYTNNGQSTLFVQGDAKSYLTKSEYKFSGKALYGKDGNYSEAKSEVNIATRNSEEEKANIKVTITPENQPAFTFNGKFDSANTYSGNSDGVTHRGAIYTKGFSWSSQAEAAGVFYRHEGEYKGYNGVYGATGQKVETE